MAKRIRVTVNWNKSQLWWEGRWFSASRGLLVGVWDDRRTAVQETSGALWLAHQATGTLYEMVVKNKTNGRISETRSYGKDPRRSKG
jgi:hypothetical protein